MKSSERFFDLLTPAAQDVVPVHYRKMTGRPIDDAVRLRIAASDHHRAEGYQCSSFYKPISRYRSDVPGTDG